MMIDKIKEKINGKSKPLGALGSLENIAEKICSMQQTTNPLLTKPTIIVFAGDHGIADTNLVNPYPKAITALMVNNFVSGGAAINVFCKTNDINLKIVDAGVDFEFDKNLPIEHLKINNGTKNYLEQKAISDSELKKSFEHVNTLIETIHKDGCNIIGFGEMGIGNTSSASLIMSAILNLPIAECVGKGTGVNEEQLKIKISTLEKVVAFHESNLNKNDTNDILQTYGGFEIAMMTAAFLKVAELKMTIIVDGFIATAAYLLAHKMNPNIINYSIFSHCSGEQGHKKMLEYLKAEPILNLKMRLGEGTGCAIAYPIIKNAVAFVNGMSNLSDLT